MKEALEGLLRASLPLPGVAAWSARLTDRSLASYCYTDWFNSKQAESVLNRLALAAESLDQHHLRPERLAWTFEHARILLARRSDGACLAFFVENRPETPLAALESLLEKFLGLDAAAK
ncbi:hypothetical protein SBV1_1140019 [Verrucomicrobia bacterium]|nr:hypothetical protein SBV1_1140019 [Verrucomicrobiota bacterium]